MNWLKRLLRGHDLERQPNRMAALDMAVAPIEHFRRKVEVAIRSAAAEANRAAGSRGLFGFALLTDDDVETVFHAFASRDWVAEREGGYPEIGFIAVEWTELGSDELFLPLSHELRELAVLQPRRAPDPDEGRVLRFETLVNAMTACREAGLFDERTLLTVGSTDPDDLMLELDCNAADRLNTREVATAYRRVMVG